MKRKTTTPKTIKALTPRSPDTKFFGDEKVWETMPAPEARKRTQIRAFSWYNYYCDSKDSKKFTIDWMSRNGFPATGCQQTARCPDREFPPTLGWMCRMSDMGWVLDEREKLYIANRIKELQGSTVEEKPQTPESKTPKFNIQDRLREKMQEAGGEIEGMFDDLIEAGCRMSAQFKPIEALRRLNVAPQMISDISDHWRCVRDEFNEAAGGKNPDLLEGYRGRSKIDLRNMIRFAEQVIADCASYVQVKKVERKPRKKKPVSPEKLTARFRYLREFAELGLKSVPVTDLVNAQEAWLYDTRRRKLIYVVHEDVVGSFSVKGSGLIGFDPTASVRKTLRKPKEQLKALMSAGAPAARKLFKSIKSTETKFNGRGNPDMIILRVR